jgi:NarL family two-component system sensor histidine kinase YdfH
LPHPSHLTTGRGERAKAIVEQAMTRARSTLADARSAIDDFRGGLAVGPVSEAIRIETERFSSAKGIACTLEIAPTLARPSLPRRPP